MADLDSGTKSSSDNSDEISLEDIDQLLSEDDPEFLQEMSAVSSVNEPSGVEIDLIEIDTAVLQADEDKDSKMKQILESFPKIKNSLIKFEEISSLTKQKIFFFASFLLRSSSNIYQWLRFGLPDYLRYLASQAKRAKNSIFQAVSVFKAWSFKKKILSIVVCLLVFFSIYLIIQNMSGTWIPRFEANTVLSFDKLGKLKNGKNEKWVGFLKALPQKEHQFLFKKVVVNLRADRSSESGNPMGLFEFFVQLDSVETAAEIRLREKELLDVLQRALEDLTYGDSLGEEGKDRIKSVIKKSLNERVRQGWIQEVFISNMILKP